MNEMTIIIFLIFVFLIVLSFFVFLLYRRINRIFRKKELDLENVLNDLITNVEEIDKKNKNYDEEIKKINKKLRKNISSFNVVRFKAFKEGGNQNFSAIFLNEEGKGMIISSLNVREQTNVFAKPLLNFQSEYELTIEEKKLLEESIKEIKEINNGN